MKTGIELIAEERTRQIAVEGWTPEHDDQHTNGALAVNAAAQACAGTDAQVEDFGDAPIWPLRFKNRINQLAKAGALIAAEIDRLQRRAAPADAAKQGNTP